MSLLSVEDRQLHYAAGVAFGAPLRFVWGPWADRAIVWLDRQGWAREVAQHDETLTDHQRGEAEAWGDGARAGSGRNPPRPVPPYPA